ncbi:hypothetical protein EZV62_003298 [Acer yangbiense]|uniref:DUF4220 domain-containing protein n=1 Tax=Acer yangbiense TaxID=1000413 RepID=A0A5C7IGI9_9ROSI|nr:hypothetical protein EZV62_003298 [Acer yangbiense]
MDTMQLFSEKVARLWNLWEVRLLVLLSLVLQVILIIFGARRKISARSWIRILVWSVYMTADSVATVALGILSRSQLGRNNNLQAFWAPFLLLHLGGPDTITAYALEDNELWLRHFLGLVVQVGVAFHVFFKSWSNSAITFINIPIFISGIIKYGERNFVLRSSSTQYFRDSLPSRPDECKEFVTVVEKDMSGEFAEGSLEELPEILKEIFKGFTVEVQDDIAPKDYYIVQAYFCFKKFKYIFANLLLDDKERECIVSTITDKNAVDAFKMVAVELGFIYDVFYTKAAIVYSRLGIFLRCISFICSLSALVVFSIIIDVHSYSLTDISITYLLLVGAVLLEIYAFLLLLFSDWTKIWLIKLKKETSKTLFEPFWRFISESAPLLSKRRRWSGSIGQYNLISSCLRKVQPAYFGVQKLPFVGESLDKYWHLNREDMNNNIEETIFNFLKKHGDLLNGLEGSEVFRDYFFTLRGNFTLQKWYGKDFFSESWTVDIEFVDSLVIWHIATDLLYYGDLDDIPEGDVSKLDPKCKVSKYLSDYMLYLLEFCPFMLLQGFGLIRYKEACAEAINLFKEKRLDDIPKACKDLLETYPQQVENKDDLAKMLIGEKQSLPMYGCMLSRKFQELTNIHRQRKWEVIGDVWAEMMGFAAHNCGWKEHAQQLREGGELLTHVFLVMAHFGLSKQYTGHKLMQSTYSLGEARNNIVLEAYVEKQRWREGNIEHV